MGFNSRLLLSAPTAAWADSPFGIDHYVALDNGGIWQRRYQKDLMGGTIITVLGGALLLGDQNQLGDTFWRALDSMAVASVAAQGLKWTFGRERPSTTRDPDAFFHGLHNQSFPSGEVAAIAGAVTPFIARYGSDHPSVYALELLPLYDAVARVKAHGHWQSDVLVGWALGTAAGIWMANRKTSLLVNWLPGGFAVGIVHRF